MPMKTPIVARYLLVLAGGGDKSVTVITEEYWAWITRKDTPGRVGTESGWLDTACPPAMVTSLAPERTWVTVGSFENDRALWVSNCRDVPGIDTFDTVHEALDFVKSKGLTLKNEYHGYIY